jgi:catechol 2,3-dioxygenase-like lactoylglutathione lyase family enzyme
MFEAQRMVSKPAARKTSSSPLADAKVGTFVATANAERARQFYESTLGLRLVADEFFALVFDVNGTMLRIQKVEKVTPAPYTVLGWRVKDIVATAGSLAERGVKFERYNGMPQDEQGIWQSPSGAKIAWFKDPDGNTLSLAQFPNE